MNILSTRIFFWLPVATLLLYQAAPAQTTASATSTLPPIPLKQVKYWACQTQEVAAAGAVDALVNSRYDMVVIDPTRTDLYTAASRAFDTRKAVAQLKASPSYDGKHRKIVLAAIEIGEAEEWRWYWTWSKAGDSTSRPADWPAYLLGHDDEAWEGCWTVAFWDKQWKELILGNPPSLPGAPRDYINTIDEAIRDGFDGLYLDGVDVYDQKIVTAAARKAGLESDKEMANFIRDIAAYARKRNPGMLILQQNGSKLITLQPESVNVIDGIIQEEPWYCGEVDCDWDEEDAHDDPQDASYTRDVLACLELYRKAGKPVFTVDFTIEHASETYARAREKGFVPYCSQVALSRLTTTPPFPGATTQPSPATIRPAADKSTTKRADSSAVPETKTLPAMPMFYRGFRRPDGSELVYGASAPASVQSPSFLDSGALIFTYYSKGYSTGPAGIYKLSGSANPVSLYDDGESDACSATGACWSKSLGRLVFSCDCAEKDDIWTMTGEGKSLTQVTKHTTNLHYTEPTFSPDGKWIVFEMDNDAKDEKQQQAGIWKVRLDGTGMMQLTSGPRNGFDDRQPNWSPAGDRVLFQRRVLGSDEWQLYTVGADGVGLRRLTMDPTANVDGSWSPDGKWVVYSTDRDKYEVSNIFVISSTGGTPIRITRAFARHDTAPAWSPSGKWIFFESHTSTKDDSPTSIWRIPVPDLAAAALAQQKEDAAEQQGPGNTPGHGPGQGPGANRPQRPFRHFRR